MTTIKNKNQWLIACEESQEVCKAFRAIGIEAYSCDILNCSGGHPEWHIKADVRNVLYSRTWSGVIAHPVCTRLANSGVRWFTSRKPRLGYVWSTEENIYINADPAIWTALKNACNFYNFFVNYGKAGNRIAIENPIQHKYARRFIDTHKAQFIQPWQFGHKKMKATGLLLYGLPELIHTDIVGPPPTDVKERYKWQDVWTASPGPDRAKLRSKTYPGIAKAMAEQWGSL